MKLSREYSLRRIAARMLACLLGVAFVACAAAAEAGAGGRIFLWEIKSATNSVYLFGSLHVARPDFYPLPRTVEDAYRQADELVVELDVTDPAKVARGVPLLMYSPPDSLDKHLSPETWKMLEAMTAAAKQDAASLKPLKPALLVSALMMGALASHDYKPQAGIDRHFLQLAHADAKPVVDLETAEFQAAILSGLSDEDGDMMLREMIDELRTGDLLHNIEDLSAAWRAGDVESTARLMHEANKDPASQRLYTKLFDERNGPLADKIASLAAGPKRALVVIGAGHLAGENSVVDLLKAKGLQVRQCRAETCSAPEKPQ
ncbi:MAG TPA: TraB/GumN family protein [Burkholderiaceae bacterium]